MPKRIKRTWFWTDRPTNTVDVSRASKKYGNPFKDADNATLVARHKQWVTDPDAQPITYTTANGTPRTVKPPTADDIAALAGKNLACFCDLDQPCHADTLLDLANR